MYDNEDIEDSEGEVRRKLASIQKVVALEPIEGADKIEVATVLGWKLVVRKGELQVGDACVYFEVDSIIPETILRKSGLWDDKNNKGLLGGSKGDRLKTKKIKQQISQGLLLPIKLFQN